MRSPSFEERRAHACYLEHSEVAGGGKIHKG